MWSFRCTFQPRCHSQTYVGVAHEYWIYLVLWRQSHSTWQKGLGLYISEKKSQILKVNCLTNSACCHTSSFFNWMVPHPLNMYFSLFFLTLCLSSSFSGTLPYLTCLKVFIPWRTILGGTVPASLLYSLLQQPLQFSCYWKLFCSSVQQIRVKFLLCLKTHDAGEITAQVHIGIGPRRSVFPVLFFSKSCCGKTQTNFLANPK